MMKIRLIVNGVCVRFAEIENKPGWRHVQIVSGEDVNEALGEHFMHFAGMIAMEVDCDPEPGP